MNTFKMVDESIGSGLKKSSLTRSDLQSGIFDMHVKNAPLNRDPLQRIGYAINFRDQRRFFILKNESVFEVVDPDWTIIEAMTGRIHQNIYVKQQFSQASKNHPV